jgi:ATP phosphoribosyltransferase
VLSAATALGENTAATGERLGGGGPGPQRVARIGLPFLSEVRDIVHRYIGVDGRGDNIDDTVVKHKDVFLFFGRSLDLVRMVDRGVLDFALVGSDMAIEVGEGNFAVRTVLGVFNAVLATVAPSAPQFAPRRVIAQYPRAAERYFAREGTEVVPVVGMAETWLGTGEFDGAVDTWRTGRTAEGSGLGFVDAVASTSLVVVEGVAAPAAARQFVEGFVSWIRGGARR